MKALITGASSGIGRDMAHYLSNLGYDLILVATNKDRLEAVKEKCKTNVEVITCDLRKEKEIHDLYEKTKKANIDILINNAGFGLFGEFYETDLNRELEMIDVNIKAVHILTKLFLNDFIKRDSGYILNVASSAGFMAGPKLSTYYATKNYVLKLTEAIYEELKKNKSHVNISALCPGPVNTNFNDIAGGSFSVKGLSSEYVAKYGIDKMFKGKLIIIPGFNMKLAIFGTRFLSIKTLLKITYKIQDEKTR